MPFRHIVRKRGDVASGFGVLGRADRLKNWTEVLGSERLTGAVLDRLTHRCRIIEMNGESYRLKDAKRGRRNGPKTTEPSDSA